MAYLLPNHNIGFGERTKNYVIREGSVVINLTRKKSLKYEDLKNWRENYRVETFKRKIGESLDLSELELDIVFREIVEDMDNKRFEEKQKERRRLTPHMALID